MKKRLLIVIVLAVAIGVGIWGWRRVTQSSDDGGLVLHGNVDIRQVSLAFDGSGRLERMHTEEGDRIKAGDLLAEVDMRTLALQADQAKAQIGVQEQTLARLRNGSRPEEIAQACNRLAAAEADAVQAANDLKRLEGIAGQTQGRGVSAQDLNRMKSNLQVSRAKAAEQKDARPTHAYRVVARGRATGGGGRLSKDRAGRMAGNR